MKMTHKIGISLIGLCALLLLGSPIYAGIWTTMGGGCTPDDGSVDAVQLLAGVQHFTGITGTIATRCNIVDVQDSFSWDSLNVTYVDPDGTGTNYRVRAALIAVSALNGELDLISTLDSNDNAQSDPTSSGVPIDHDWDFRANAYYLYVTVFRADDASIPKFFRAEISDALSQVVQVFVTSSTSGGDLGGLAGGDAICQERAEAGGLAGTWVAWLSDDDTFAINRIPHGQYRLIDDTLIAVDKGDLTDGFLEAPIDRNEFGEKQDGFVWTGTKSDGTNDTNEPNCSNWTTQTEMSFWGDSNSRSSTWTLHTFEPCSELASLYCFGGGE